MQMVVICEMFGWTYFEYLQQPTFFIDLIVEKLRIDGHKMEAERKKLTKK